ncbi:hypothetical protein FB107DRAFT_280728 [Schizophyllum commune]
MSVFMPQRRLEGPILSQLPLTSRRHSARAPWMTSTIRRANSSYKCECRTRACAPTSNGVLGASLQAETPPKSRFMSLNVAMYVTLKPPGVFIGLLNTSHFEPIDATAEGLLSPATPDLSSMERRCDLGEFLRSPSRRRHARGPSVKDATRVLYAGREPPEARACFRDEDMIIPHEGLLCILVICRPMRPRVASLAGVCDEGTGASTSSRSPAGRFSIAPTFATVIANALMPPEACIESRGGFFDEGQAR